MSFYSQPSGVGKPLKGPGTPLLGRVSAMTLDLLLGAASVAAATVEHGEPAISPYAVGAIALGLLLAVLGALVAFGGGREHS